MLTSKPVRETPDGSRTGPRSRTCAGAPALHPTAPDDHAPRASAPDRPARRTRTRDGPSGWAGTAPRPRGGAGARQGGRIRPRPSSPGTGASRPPPAPTAGRRSPRRHAPVLSASGAEHGPKPLSCRKKDRPDARREQPLPEYDSLANVYDLEYAHDYDLPFWLSLAEREAGPVIEWGAGTGRIAVPLAAAGHDVTAVEVSAGMVDRGREKGQAVGWILGDMRDAKPERSYGLAVCAFNSFLCLG